MNFSIFKFFLQKVHAHLFVGIFPTYLIFLVTAQSVFINCNFLFVVGMQTTTKVCILIFPLTHKFQQLNCMSFLIFCLDNYIMYTLISSVNNEFLNFPLKSLKLFHLKMKENTYKIPDEIKNRKAIGKSGIQS